MPEETPYALTQSFCCDMSGTDMLLWARNTLDCLRAYPAPPLQKPIMAARFGQICGMVSGVSNLSATAALVLAEAMWALNMRLRWDTPPYRIAEEETLYDMGIFHDNMGRHQTWQVGQAMALVLELRNALLGPVPSLGYAMPLPKQEHPLRQHQKAIVGMHTRWRFTGNPTSRQWLEEAIQRALAVEPSTPKMLSALERFSAYVLAFYAPGRTSSETLQKKLRVANADILHHLRRNPELREEPFGALITHLPCQ